MSWITDFERRHGRAPRVLHVDNIANNAYNNARLLVARGVACDVICADNYHIMACPEWESAEIRGDVGDHFNPDWSAVRVTDFERPDWFAQGPLRAAVRYLIARAQGRRRRARAWQALMDGYRAIYSQRRLRLVRAGSDVARDVLRPGVHALRRRWLDRAYLREKSSDAGDMPDAFTVRASELTALFGQSFPDRRPPLSAGDVELHHVTFPYWRALFEHYDLVQAYSTTTALPLLAGKRPYVGYEHGTLRDIPFEDSAAGRLTALSYARADYTIVTNPDCEAAARRLEIDRFKYVPHIIDDKYYAAGGADRQRTVLSLARHDWSIKGNDRLLRAFARFADSHPDFELVTATWGEDVDRSRRLASELGIADRVRFTPPLSTRALIREMSRAAVFADQFHGYFGGLSAAALATGTPLVMHLDFDRYAWCWDGPPPYFEGRDEDTLVAALGRAVFAGPSAYRDDARAWMRRNYWYEDAVQAHLDIYGELLAGRGGGAS